MTRIFAILLTLTAGSAFASTDAVLDQARQDEVRAALTAQGYDVGEIEAEDDMIEVYAMKDGVSLELLLDQNLQIVESETGDNDDEGDEDHDDS